MVHEARRAGLRFDEEKMIEMRCLDPEAYTNDGPALGDNSNGHNDDDDAIAPDADVPTFKISGVDSPSISGTGAAVNNHAGAIARTKPTEFQENLRKAATKGVLHDCLEFGQGLPVLSVASWKMMEYLPFKRMDLL